MKGLERMFGKGGYSKPSKPSGGVVIAIGKKPEAKAGGSKQAALEELADLLNVSDVEALGRCLTAYMKPGATEVEDDEEEE